jgi:aryl-alcohol dehydrogenase-like predicted oxidoreductase
MAAQRASNPDLPLPVIATKFAPQLWRFSRDSVVIAAKASLGRLGLPKMDLYMQHWVRRSPPRDRWGVPVTTRVTRGH